MSTASESIFLKKTNSVRDLLLRHLALAAVVATLFLVPEPSFHPLKALLLPQGLVLAPLSSNLQVNDAWITQRLESAAALTSELSQSLPESTRKQKQRRARVLLAQIATLSDPNDLKWQDWIRHYQYSHAQFSALLLELAATQLPVSDALALLQPLDQRTTPPSLRLAVFRLLWALDESMAFSRSQRYLSQESPRANDITPIRLIEEIVAPLVDSPLAGNLVLEVAASRKVNPSARLQALRACEAHKPTGATSVAEAIFLSASDNLALRHQGLLTTLQLDPERGHRLLMERVPPSKSQPATYEFMLELRRKEGLSPLAPGPLSSQK